MEKLKFKIHPLFVVFACVLVYFGKGFLFLNYIIVIILHEFAHAFVAKKLGYRMQNITLIPFGVCLNIYKSNMPPKDEIKVAIAGPLLNLFICLILFTSWWLFPFLYNYTYLFCFANFITGVFNFLPAFPLDGGRVLLSLLRERYGSSKAIKISKIVAIILSILLFLCFIISCFFAVNVTYILVLICILSGIKSKDKSQEYTLIDFSGIKKIKNITKIKNLYVRNDEKLYKAYRFVDSFSFVNLYIYDENNNLEKILSENEYLNLLSNNDIHLTFKNTLNLR